MKILVIFTGGTIGSSVTDGYITPQEGNGYKLLQMYQKKCALKTRPEVTFETLQPFQTLSENSTCRTLLQLIQCVSAEAKKDYDGIILCHGTDTLQFSGTALGYALGLESIPVLLVSSNYVLDDKRAKGLAHFAASVAFIREKCGKGVFITYQNDGECVRIHRGTRVLPHPPYSDSVCSIFDQYYGEITGDVFENPVFEKNPAYHEKEEEADLCIAEQVENIVVDSNGKNTEQSLEKMFSHILELYPAPGFQYPKLAKANEKEEQNIRAILHHTYHSGTICSVTPGLADFAKEASKLQIPIFLTGANLETDYESAKVFEELHIKVLPEASPIAMYVKLWLCLVCNCDPDEVLYESLGGDLY